MPIPEYDYTIADVTDGTINGQGSFDKLIATMDLHLNEQYSSNRIKGTEYANVYLGIFNNVLQQSIQYSLSKDRAGLEAEIAERNKLLLDEQILKAQTEGLLLASQLNKSVIEESIVAENLIKVGKENALMDLQIARATTENTITTVKARMALVEESIQAVQLVKVGTERDLLASQLIKSGHEESIAANAVTKSGLENTLLTSQTRKTLVEEAILDIRATKEAVEKALLDSQLIKSTSEQTIAAEAAIKAGTDSAIAVEQLDRAVIENAMLAVEQAEQLVRAPVQTATIQKQDANEAKKGLVLDEQVSKIQADSDLVVQKKVTETAQTANQVDTYDVDGNVTNATDGIIGAQRRVYKAQSDGFNRDAEQKLLKVMSDAFNVQYSTDPTLGREFIDEENARRTAAGNIEPQLDYLNVDNFGFGFDQVKDIVAKAATGINVSLNIPNRGD